MENHAGVSTGRLKAVSVTTLVLVVLGAAAAFYLTFQHSRELERVQADANATESETRRQAAAVANELASDLTASIAVLISDDVARLEYERLRSALATVVHGHRVTGVVVLDSGGTVVAATDQRFSGRTMDDPGTRAALDVTAVTVLPQRRTSGEIEVVAPLLVADQRTGAIRVFVDLGPFADRPGDPAN